MIKGNSFKLKMTDWGRIYKEDITYNESGDTLKQVSQSEVVDTS